MSNLGLPTKFLDIEIDRDEDGTSLSQETYIKTILKRFEMQETNGSIPTPVSTNRSLDL
jgi:hypothetical protein